MSVERPHEDRLGSGGTAVGEVLTRTGTGVAEWAAPTGGTGSGAMGPPGAAGQDGADGSPGPAGAAGAAGATGATGAAGAAGAAGATGGSAQLASITAASAAIANTETVVVSASLAANYLTAGMSFRIRAAGVGTTGLTPGVDTFRIRLGTTTLTGNIVTSVAPPANGSVTAQPFSFEALVTLRTAGAGGTIIGECLAVGDDVATGLFTLLVDLSATTATVAVDTTATKLLELTFQSGSAGSSCTFHVATIEVLSSGAAGSTPALVGCFAYHSTTQSFAATTLTYISLDSEQYDTSAFHNLVTNNSRLVAPTTGYYLCWGGIWYATTSGTNYILLDKNHAGTFIRGSVTAQNGGGSGIFLATPPIFLTAGDYIEMVGYHTQAGTIATGDTGTTPSQQNYLAMQFVGV